MMKQMEQEVNSEETYLIEKAADILGIQPVTVLQYASKGTLTPIKNEEGKIIAVTQASVHAYKEKRMFHYPRRPQAAALHIHKPLIDPALPFAYSPAPLIKKKDEIQLMQEVVAAIFYFLRDHQMIESVQAFKEVSLDDMRLWEALTPEVKLHILVKNDGVQVLADLYQEKLEEKVRELETQLREANARLSSLQKPQRIKVLEEYAETLEIIIEPHPRGFLVYAPLFPFATLEKTEEEAIAAFHRTLKGYTWHLHIHETQLNDDLKTEFELLRALLLEDF